MPAASDVFRVAVKKFHQYLSWAAIIDTPMSLTSDFIFTPVKLLDVCFTREIHAPCHVPAVRVIPERPEKLHITHDQPATTLGP